MKLQITHHALDRMGTFHVNLMSLVPSSVGRKLPPNEAYRVLKAATLVLRGLEAGMPVKLSEDVRAYKAARYGTEDFYVYDKKHRDIYTLVHEPPAVVVVTITRLSLFRTLRVVRDPNPAVVIQDVEAVELPYCLAPGPVDPRLTRVFRKSGQEVKATFHEHEVQKEGVQG